LNILKKRGEIAISRVAADEEYWIKLKEKLAEEVDEFSRDEDEEEIADVLEVLDAIITYKKFDPDNIQRIKIKKAEEKGIFKQRIILEEA